VKTMSLPLPDLSLADRVLEKLLEETRLAIEAGDLPVGCVLTVGDTLLDSNRNTIRSQQGRRFHAERNLLAQLGDLAIPAGRRVVWVTLEPCLRCAQAIQRFGADEVVYVLDDPFRGGKALLAQAGITVTRRGEWERDYLRLMMDFYARYPEFCAVRQFRFALDAWQRHEPLGHDEQVKAVFLHHLASYLPNVTAARQEEVRSAFLAHVNHLTGITLEECVDVPSVAFVRNLHRALFPPDYRHRAVGNDGVASETASGEWRRHVLWPCYREFSAVEAIETDLTALLDHLSVKALLLREDVMRFILDFWIIHPFTDGNGRTASILADLICLNHGLAPLALDRKNELFYTALMENLSHGAPITEQLHLVDAWNRGLVEIRPISIYDNLPSAFQTFTRRSGNKQHVAEHILAKLAGRNLEQHFVVTDIGADTGIIADGVLHGLLQREGMTFEYHYLEPSQTSVDYFRANSRYAALPQVVTHTMPVEDYLLPPSDLIMVSQALQHIANPMETLHDIVSALKPGGLALIVVTHPEGDEFTMLNRLAPRNGIYPHVKDFFDKQRIEYEEVGVETFLRITPADRNTPEGDDLLAFYFLRPAHTLLSALKEAFWAGLAEFARDGGVMRKEAFFWLRRKGSGEVGSMNNPFPPETRHLQETGLSGVISASESSRPNTLMSFDETIEASLLPRLLYTLEKKPEQEHQRLILNFRSHVRLLSEYLRGEIIDGNLSLNTAVGFHMRLYPPGYMLDSADKDRNPVKISPGAWRQREIRDGVFKSHRWHSVCSPMASIESDLKKTISVLNEIQNPRREDILRFFFLFNKVHPFADSNGTTSAVLADALCARYGLAPLLPSNIRFKDKSFLWRLCAEFEENQSEQSLTNILRKIDAFHRSFPLQRLQ